MALKLRRGTENERTSTVFEEGEPVYVTDTGELYIGDGTTAGGLRVRNELELDNSPALGGNLDLNQFAIEGTGNINIDGNITATGNIELGNGVEDNITVGGQIGSSLIPDADSEYDLGASLSKWRDGFFSSLEADGEIKADTITVNTILGNDSTILWQSSSNEIQTNLRGSVFSEDSGLIINSDTGDITAGILTVDIVDTGDLRVPFDAGGKISLTPFDSETRMELQVRGNESDSLLRLSKVVSTDITGEPGFYGQINFEREDVNGPLLTTTIGGAENLLFFANDSTGDFTDTSKFIGLRNGLLGIGTIDAVERLDVHGNSIIRGNLTVTDGLFNSPSFTTTGRDNLTPQNGSIIYNSTDNSFQGYQDGVWINLIDGSPA